ncbi:MAG: biopolymer transporter ExbB [Bdellovibrionales bacterium RIFOXYB1_FULL_37_110]|nr:MAG: biopolymer transporter ExbB [Bdellovibrionales bacterium RIFOXYA1_FULL_38_20]OFZ52533.1 MAG: biopolymer transporter ExbB [Bdellovibrionales bacterium RIFOXYC1_FULL_37_79]OFZ55586.1 MAG: biopolymer transporter ExbB [Bdellovibrionales bacterium RIFOXYB2_FULL_36_6]OFZ59735.1 MAG: biopolymer transporter ExbB [Bdellovibrionales bacterium RIFOXYB1_FULL_37_110]OFZ63546.1 MAG: biopolymer transporter ExbB [Bdellovibrionales bacterium RIFOXYD1_FULL_36_51]
MRVINYIEQGGPIMYLLLLINMVGFAIMFYKFYMFYKEKNKISDRVKSLEESLAEKKIATKDPSIIIELSKKEIAEHMRKLESGVNTIKIIATISPLLGLLGTVVGILIAFQVIASTGLNSPENFAQGISMALITTVGGLIVAIPHYIGHSYLLGILDSLETKLEKELLRGLL